MVDLPSPRHVTKVIIECGDEDYILKKKSSILAWCHDYIELFGKPAKPIKKKGAPRGILKTGPAKPKAKAKKKVVRPPSSSDVDSLPSGSSEDFSGSQEISLSGSGSFEDEPVSRATTKKAKKQKGGYAKMELNYKPTKDGTDVYAEAKKMSKMVNWEN